MKNSSELLRNAKTIAVVRTDRLGDMVLTLPLIKQIKDSFPGAEVTLIARTYVEPLVSGMDFIDEIYYTDRYSEGIKDIFRIKDFDAVFFPRPRFNECFAAYQSNVRLRIGSAYRWYSVLFNKKVKDHRKKAEHHEAEYNLRMLSSITLENYPLKLVKPKFNDQSMKTVIYLITNNNISKDNFIILHPGSGGSSNDLPISSMIEIGNYLANDLNQNLIITGSKEEYQNCSEISLQIGGSVNVAGKLNMTELFVLISLSRCLVSNSTGVIHIAASLGIKTIGFYPNSPHLSQKRWGPITNDSLIINPPLSQNKKKIDEMAEINLADTKNKICMFI